MVRPPLLIPTAVFVLGILLMAAVPGIAILTNRGADPPPVSEVALFVVGDWGREEVSQNACADAMAAVAPSSAPPSPTPRRVRISASSAPATTSTRMVSPPSMIPRSRARSKTCTARVRISRRSCGTPPWETTTTAETSPRRSRDARRRTRAPANRDGTRCDVDTASSAARRRGTPASSASVSSTPRRGSSDTATTSRGTRTWRRCCVTREELVGVGGGGDGVVGHVSDGESRRVARRRRAPPRRVARDDARIREGTGSRQGDRRAIGGGGVLQRTRS